MKTFRIYIYTLVISAVLLSFPLHADSENIINAITVPSADVNLSFTQPGRIAAVHVREGDTIKAGKVLIQQDDAAEQAQLSQLKAQSEDTNEIEGREASLAQKKLYLKRLEWASERGSATELEVEAAKLDVKIAELSLKVAMFDHEQNKGKYQEAQIRVNNMRLKSPIDGRVEKIEVEVGESINGLDDAVRVVRTDPLWIDVHVPLEKSRALKLNQSAKIRFPESDKEPVIGKIIFISTVADAASTTLAIRIEFPNKANRPAGEHVSVDLSTTK